MTKEDEVMTVIRALEMEVACSDGPMLLADASPRRTMARAHQAVTARSPTARQFMSLFFIAGPPDEAWTDPH